MVRIKIVRDIRATMWHFEKNTLFLVMPLSRKSLLVDLHEIGHCIKKHGSRYCFEKEIVPEEIEAWEWAKKIISFFSHWTSDDKRHMQYCLAAYKLVYKFRCGEYDFERFSKAFYRLRKYHPKSTYGQELKDMTFEDFVKTMWSNADKKSFRF